MYKITNKIMDIQSPPISEVRSWLSESSQRTRPLIDLCQAVPDYLPHQDLLNCLKAALHTPEIARYTPDEGLAEVRASLSQWYSRRYSAGPTAEEICLTIGASQAFWLTMTMLCQAGDQVIVQSPAYFDHPMGLQALGLEPVFIPYDPQDPEPDPEQLAPSVMTPRPVTTLANAKGELSRSKIRFTDISSCVIRRLSRHIIFVLLNLYGTNGNPAWQPDSEEF